MKDRSSSRKRVRFENFEDEKKSNDDDNNNREDELNNRERDRDRDFERDREARSFFMKRIDNTCFSNNTLSINATSNSKSREKRRRRELSYCLNCDNINH